MGRRTERYSVERLTTRWGKGWRVRDNERGEYVSEILPTQERAERCKAALIRDDEKENGRLGKSHTSDR